MSVAIEREDDAVAVVVVVGDRGIVIRVSATDVSSDLSPEDAFPSKQEQRKAILFSFSRCISF